MTLCAGVSLAVHLHYLEARLNRQECFVRLRTWLYYAESPSSENKTYASPTTLRTTRKSPYATAMCSTERDSSAYYSKAIRVVPGAQRIAISQVCEFRGYIEVSVKPVFYIRCEMLFSTDPNADRNEFAAYRVYSTYEGTVTQKPIVSDYVPMYFDEFESIMVHSSLHQCLTQIQFLRLDRGKQEELRYYNFYEYVQQHSNGCKPYRYLDRQQETQQLFNNLFGRLNRSYEGLQQLLQSFEGENRTITKLNANPQLIRQLSSLGERHIKAMDPANSCVARLIHQELARLGAEVNQLWSKLGDALLRCQEDYMRKQRNRYESFYRKRLQKHLYRQTIRNDQLMLVEDEGYGRSNLHEAQHHWNYEPTEDLQHIVEGFNEHLRRSRAPKLFEEVYFNEHATRKSMILPPRCRTIFVLVHGFQATRWDFITFKGFLETIIPDCQVFISTINEGRTDQSIPVLASAFSKELLLYLAGISYKYKLTFIGHSMGGIIIREALHLIGGLASKFHCYVSLSTPHLGLHSTGIVGAGLWYLKNWENCQSIRELAMEDSAVPQECFLYKLSLRKELRYFQNIVFVSSYQDQYVSYPSARVQLLPENASQHISLKYAMIQCRTHLLNDMARNITAGVECGRLHRIDAIFPIREKTLDTFIGRAAHVSFLADHAFIKLLVRSFSQLLT